MRRGDDREQAVQKLDGRDVFEQVRPERTHGCQHGWDQIAVHQREGVVNGPAVDARQKRAPYHGYLKSLISHLVENRDLYNSHRYRIKIVIDLLFYLKKQHLLH